MKEVLLRPNIVNHEIESRYFTVFYCVSEMKNKLLE